MTARTQQRRASRPKPLAEFHCWDQENTAVEHIHHALLHLRRGATLIRLRRDRQAGHTDMEAATLHRLNEAIASTESVLDAP